MILHSLNPRVAGSSMAARSYTRALLSTSRSFQTSPRALAPIFAASHQPHVTSQPRQSTRSAHAISNPTLAGIEKRWETMPPQEQAELWMQLRDRMKVDWNEMTLQEKKAAWWIAFGPHGPRAGPVPGEWPKIWLYTALCVGASCAIFFFIHTFARPPPKSMTKEWQEATNEYLKGERANPIYGMTSEGYSGKGYVMSKSAKSQGIKLDDDE